MRPGAASPFHVPNHRAVRSGSVTLAHTSSIGARNVRLTTSSLPSAIWMSWPLDGLVIPRSPVVDPPCPRSLRIRSGPNALDPWRRVQEDRAGTDSAKEAVMRGFSHRVVLVALALAASVVLPAAPSA